MTNVVKTLKESKSACWIAWACLVVPMFASYFFDDMFSTISHIFKNPEMLELGWNTMDYGFYAGGYSFLCVWGGLIVCGMLLDKWGVRVTGSIFVGLMAAGAALVAVGTAAKIGLAAIGKNMGNTNPSYTYSGGGYGVNMATQASNQQVEVVGVLKGQDIYLASEKYQQSKRR